MFILFKHLTINFHQQYFDILKSVEKQNLLFSIDRRLIGLIWHFVRIKSKIWIRRIKMEIFFRTFFFLSVFLGIGFSFCCSNSYWCHRFVELEMVFDYHYITNVFFPLHRLCKFLNLLCFLLFCFYLYN